jgi:hypothetical protein
MRQTSESALRARGAPFGETFDGTYPRVAEFAAIGSLGGSAAAPSLRVRPGQGINKACNAGPFRDDYP